MSSIQFFLIAYADLKSGIDHEYVSSSFFSHPLGIIPATEETLVQTIGGVTITSISGGTPITLTQANGQVITSTSGGVTAIRVSGGSLTTAVVTRSARTIARIAATSQASAGERMAGGGSGWGVTVALTLIPFIVGVVWL